MKINEPQLKRIFINPFYAVNFHPGNFGDHKPLVTKEEWIKVNKQLIEEVGVDDFLSCLLDIIENGPITSDELSEPFNDNKPFGYTGKKATNS